MLFEVTPTMKKQRDEEIIAWVKRVLDSDDSTYLYNILLSLKQWMEK